MEITCVVFERERERKNVELAYLWNGYAGSKYVATSVTRLGDLLDFGQLFKAFSNNEFV